MPSSKRAVPRDLNHVLRRRGFTLMELAVALGVFVVFAVATASVTISATSSHSQLRARNNATVALDQALASVVSESGYGLLSVGELQIPSIQREPCDPAEESCLLSTAELAALAGCYPTLIGPLEGCLLYGNSALKVTYTIETEPVRLQRSRGVTATRPGTGWDYVGSVKLLAEAVLPNGRTLRGSYTVAAPHQAAAADTGFVEIVLAGNLDGMFEQRTADGTLFTPVVRLVSGGNTLAQQQVLRTQDAAKILLTVEDAEINCTRAVPCEVEIDAGSYQISDQFRNRGANRVVVDRGAVARTTIQLTSGPGISVRLEVRPERDPALTRAPESGSVCLWGSFPSPENLNEIIYTSWCNIRNPLEVKIRGWYDGVSEQDLPESGQDGQEGITLWINPPVPLPQGSLRTVDCTPWLTPGNGIDTMDPNMRAFSANGWRQEETCTGWTWGMPRRIAFSEVNETFFVEGQHTIPVFPSLDRRVTLIWEPDRGAPAAGCGPSDPTWSYPRSVPAPELYDPQANEQTSCSDLLGQLTSAPVWTKVNLSAFTTRVFYSDRVTASGVPAPSYSVSAGALPDGITLNAATGQISGVPTRAGQYSFTLNATSSGGVVEQSYTILVLEP